jgi:uncharacterized protein YhaN
MGLPAGWPPEAISRWAEAREHALAAQAEAGKLAERLENQSGDLEKRRARLSENLEAAGQSAPDGMTLDALIDFAEDVAQKAETLETRREDIARSLERARAQDKRRQKDLADARQAEEDWRSQWTALLETCWLGASGQPRGPAEVGEILKHLDEVRRLLEATAALERDMDRMRGDETAFVTLCREVCEATGTPFDESDPGKTAAALRKALDSAQKIQTKREQIVQQMADVDQRLSESRAARDKADSALDEIMARFDVPDRDTMRDSIKTAREKARIAAAVCDHEERLRGEFDGRGIADIESELSDCNADRLQAEASELDAEVARHAEEEKERHHAMRMAEQAVSNVGTDEKAAELAEERRVLLLQIEDETRRYLRLKAGAAAAEASLRLYRDAHRSAMMRNAARTFRHITGGRFADLQSQPGNDGETLVAIRSEGGSLTVDAMSDGTRDQLYLALRLAGHKEFAGSREPLPFIADDIMQSFDDVRARASFEALAEAARIGQVIYLTHHAHLRDMAREALGDAIRIHELPGPAVEAAHAAATQRTRKAAGAA